jgi:hypothetical protein
MCIRHLFFGGLIFFLMTPWGAGVAVAGDEFLR